jgi:hypothetical protein
MQSKTFVLQPLAARSVRNAGPVQCVPIVDALAANMAMPTAVILSVGTDSSLSRAEMQLWLSTGYRVTSAGSFPDAIDNIRYGDFELALMGDSISLGDRERRASGISGRKSEEVLRSASSSATHAMTDFRPWTLVEVSDSILIVPNQSSLATYDDVA